MFSLSRIQNYSFVICYLAIIFSTIFLIVDFERLSYSQLAQQPQQSQQSQQHQANNTGNVFAIQNMSDNVKDSVYPQIESSGNNVFVVWQDNLFGHNRQNYDILLKTSSDGGNTFGEVINLSNNTGFSEHPQIAVNGSNVYIVWADNTNLNRDIYLISSSDGGNTFGEVTNLSNNTADSYNQEISVSGHNVYVTWLDSQKNIRGNSNVSFISSNDGGQTFGDVKNLSSNAGKSSFPKISSYQEDVYVAWNIDNEDKSINGANNTDGGIFLTKSVDNGNSFDNEIRLNTSDEKPGEVQIDSNGKNVYVIWGSPDPSTNYENAFVEGSNSITISNVTGDGIYFTKSLDGGHIFTKPSFIKGQFLNPLNVEIIQYLGELIVAIQATPLNNTVEGNQDIFLMRSQDDGNSFSESINISNNLGISECPSMTFISDEDLLTTWQDKSTGNNEAFLTKLNIQN